MGNSTTFTSPLVGASEKATLEAFQARMAALQSRVPERRSGLHKQQQQHGQHPPPLAPQPPQLMKKLSRSNMASKSQSQLLKRTNSGNKLMTTTTTGVVTKQEKVEEVPRMRVLSCGEAHIHHTEAEVVTMLAQIISERVSANDEAIALGAEKGEAVYAGGDIFCGPSTPKITVQDYLERLIHYLTGIARYERETGHDSNVRSDLAIRYLIMAMIYLDKMNKQAESGTNRFRVCSKNIHRLLITGITVASKIVDDVQPKNTYFAQLGGISVQELNALEREFCAILGYQLSVQPEVFDQYYSDILSITSLGQTSENVEVGRPRQGSAAAA